MAKKTPTYPRIYTDQPPAADRSRLEQLHGLEQLCQSFRLTTGWPLSFRAGPSRPSDNDVRWSMPVSPGVGDAIGYLVISAERAAPLSPAPAVKFDAASELAGAIGGLLGRLYHTQYVLWQREAELATNVPLVARPEDKPHLAMRLEAVLRGGAEAVGCQAAALYLLDDATRQLSLRAAWGLPRERFLDAPRPLRGATADLEALLGHAVVLEHGSLLPQWNIPEPFAAAVCVPVSSPTVLLGTLWIYSSEVRDFTAEQTNLIEIIAGRLATELEREILLQDKVASRLHSRQLAAVAESREDQLPQFAPLVDGWKTAAWTARADRAGGDFYDWFILQDGSLSLVVGQAQGDGLSSLVTASVLQTAVKSHSQYRHDAGQLIERVNETLWTSAAGDRLASLFYGVIQTETGKLNHAAAGQATALRVRGGQGKIITQPAPRIGTRDETSYQSFSETLAPGDTLLVIGPPAPAANDCQDSLPGEAAFAKALHGENNAPAERLVQIVRDLLEGHAPDGGDARTVLAVKRRQ